MIFGCSRFYRRWGEGSVAPRAEWRAPVGCWVLSEGDWRFELGSGVLWWKVADWVNFGQKWRYVFVVDGSGCGGLLG